MVRVTNVRLPPQVAPPPVEAPVDDERLFAEEGPADGCASGECLPEPTAEPTAAPLAAPAAEPERESVRAFDVHHAPRAAAPLMAASGKDNPRRPLQDRWRAAVDTVRAASGRHAQSLASGRLLWIREGEVAVAYLPAKDGFHKSTVSGSAGRAIVEKALAEHFGRPTRLVVQDATEGEPAPGTAAPLVSLAEEAATERAAYERSTEGRVRNHPAVRAALKQLGGEIEHIQVYDAPVRPPVTASNEPSDESP